MTQTRVYRMMTALLGGVFLLFMGAMALMQGLSLASRLAVTLPLMVLTLLLAFGLWTLGQRALQRPAIQRRLLGGLGAAALLWTQWTFVLAIYAEYGWDFAFATEAGCNLTDVGEGVYYLSLYPNNLSLSLLLGHTVWWAQDVGLYDHMLPLTCLSLVISDLSVMVGAVLARRSLGKGGMGIYLLIAIPLVLFNPWVAVPYSDALTLVFPPLILYLWDKAREASLLKGLGLWALIGLCAGVGFLLKPTALIALIAVGGLGFFMMKKDWRVWLKHILGLALALCVIVGVTQGLYLYCYSLAPGELNHETIENNSVPMSHFFMMGLTETNGEYGVYDNEDAILTENTPGRDAKTALNLKVAKERLEAMGLGGYLDFLWHKALYAWNDGVFYYSGLGNHVVVYMSEAPVDAAVQQLVNLEGVGRPLYEAWANGLWFMVLGLMALGVCQKGQPPLTHAARLTILGLALFHLLFENRSRYLVNHLPVMALAAASGVMFIRQRLRHE